MRGVQLSLTDLAGGFVVVEKGGVFRLANFNKLVFLIFDHDCRPGKHTPRRNSIKVIGRTKGFSMHFSNFSLVVFSGIVLWVANTSELRAEKDPVCVAICGGQYAKDFGNCPSSTGDTVAWAKCTEQAEKDRQKCVANCKDMPKPTPTPAPSPTKKKDN